MEPRVALHLGDIERARASTRAPEGLTSGQYRSYATAIAVEVAVAAGAVDAERQLSAAQGLGRENDFVAAILLRAAGRLHDDVADLVAAVALWETIGARFERACTLLLIPSRQAEGRDDLARLGCPLPPPPA